MEIYIFDSLLSYKGVIDLFNSLRWLRSYNSSGEFELQCPLTTDNMALLKCGNILYKKDDSECGVISYINYKKDTEGKEIIICKGNFATSYLGRRINKGTAILTGTEENAIRALVTNNAISPSDTNRTIPNLLLGANNSYVGSMSYPSSNISVLEDICNIAVLGDLGFKTIFNTETKKLTFTVYKGLDRTINQSVNSRCIFSQEFDNITESDYTNSNDNYKNVCYNATTSVGVTVGLARYEMYADKDLTVELSKRPTVTTFSSKVNTNSNLTYKIDYDLGDVVTCINKGWNISVNNRILDIEEIYEQNGLTINLTLGERIPTLLSKIKNLIK